MPTSTRRQARARAEQEQANISIISNNDIASDEVTNREDVEGSPEPGNIEGDPDEEIPNDQEENSDQGAPPQPTHLPSLLTS
jgi:hypothetical protein